ncbi:threonylcarbamoyl-AMP synthase [Candidatus Woesearchaeota archaeon]|jgi:L-threonylcarbamoyladenylate synthase|nr:threonylcarbamoyl-AMP synthase [Candidatus Woesearchaeota archaeon]MBT4150550.1 threonylcarbamoyl-AMP synthase [Candidatus Woesearchaeota archaeon]MBT4247191.1 threonylcarbamoyl-AMP synthase [Candidatus Woesearchaeota archaeon]MBT4434584.1 threonylcarbamoyl-AMP synthase [Candidatus Woesearchaeota archaeon]MBT7331957.1 threonylcarbamoyl-AMP synthase [Candidatus Woesearchaeota archaeon]
MEVLTETELRMRFDEIVDKIKNGAVFIHPTDTIYGLGCNALDEKAVEKIRDIKKRPEAPLSVWVHSKEWIIENCGNHKWLDELPGPYTLIMPLTNKKSVTPSVVKGKETLGVRLPNHWFSKVVAKLGFPIVTTSANKTGEPFMTKLENLDPNVEKEVSFMIYEGEKEARPSKLVNVEKEEVKER